MQNVQNYLNESKLKPYESYLVTSVILFMKNKLGFTTNVVPKKIKSFDLIGAIDLKDVNKARKYFILEYDSEQSIKMQIRALLHELTHINQIVKGYLKLEGTDIVWKNDFKLSVSEYAKISKDFAKYKELPWEQEAYSNMELLGEYKSSKYFAGLKGKDTTLDFLIDNI